VSDTSVSRRAIPPHCGHPVRYHSLWRASGDTPDASGLKSSMKGSSTGSCSSGTGTTPQSSQYRMGMGGPQYRCREMHQSCRR
jgi:hypothetical protein